MSILFGQQTRLHAGHDLVKFFHGAVLQLPTGIFVPFDLAATYDDLLYRVREIGNNARDELAAIVGDEKRFSGDNRTAIRDSAGLLL